MTYSIACDSEARLCHLGLIYLIDFRYVREITLQDLCREALHPARVN